MQAGEQGLPTDGKGHEAVSRFWHNLSQRAIDLGLHASLQFLVGLGKSVPEQWANIGAAQASIY
jgi:hypothetical protein